MSTKEASVHSSGQDPESPADRERRRRKAALIKSILALTVQLREFAGEHCFVDNTQGLKITLQKESPRTKGHACFYRGGRYIDEKLSKADKSVFLKLSATYRYRKMEILKLSKKYR